MTALKVLINMGYLPVSILKNTSLWYAAGVIAITEQCAR
jgi:hypothetical protein